MLDIQGRKYAAVTVCDVTLYDLNTNYPVMYFDTLQLTSIDSSVDTTDIQGGKGNATLASISHTKNIDIQFDDAIMTMSSLALLTGGELSFTNDDIIVGPSYKEEVKITMPMTELLEVKDGLKIKLSKLPKPGSYIWIAKMKDGILSTATRTENPVSSSTEEITISNSTFHNALTSSESEGALTIEVGDKVRVFYEHEITKDGGEGVGAELRVLADKFAGSYRFIGDTVLFNQSKGTNDLFQIEIPNLKLDSSYSMSFQAATEAIVFSFKGKALKNEVGEMIIFRQLDPTAISGGEATEGNALDGSFKELPAKEVLVDSDTKEITDLPESI